MPTVKAQNWWQVGSDIYGEAEDDYSGFSVSLSLDGSIIAIGAWQNDGNGIGAGHVRAYRNTSGTWTQIGDDIDGEAAYDESGYSVSLSSDGSILAIGAPKNDGNGSNSGHVRVFQNIEGIWQKIGADIDGEAINDESGKSICLNSDGSVIAIGAPNNIGNGIGHGVGQVRVYKNIEGAWIQVGDDIDGETINNFFGSSLSLNSDGSVVAIGAPYATSTDAGHVRIYHNNIGTWEQVGDDIIGEAADKFSGRSVSLNSEGSIVAIGSLHSYEESIYSGHVRIFKNNSSIWEQIGEDINGEYAGDNFGKAVSLNSDGTLIAVGADSSDGNGEASGQVRIFKNNSGEWMQLGNDIDGKESYDQSGYSVSLNGDGSTVASGSYLGGINNSGHVSIYHLSPLTIKELNLKDISIIPNPTKGIIKLDFGNNHNIQQIMIFDLTGKIIIKKTNIKQKEKIDLSALKNGIYIISIKTDKEILTSKIVRE